MSPSLVTRFRGDLSKQIDVDSARVLMGVSGGPDSVALLLLTHAALGERCHAATVDHGLRPASGDEARFVANLCAARGIDHAILTAPLPDRADGSANISGRARKLRYDLLEAHRLAIGADVIATAHHADDQLETVVMRLNRGAGVAGLAGVRAASGNLIRPVLGWRRAELEAIVATSGITPIDDPTNRDDRYDRARLRKALHSADWLDPARAVASAKALADADDALEWAADRLLGERLIRQAEVLVVDPTDLPHELRRRLALRCLALLDPTSRADGPALEHLLAELDQHRPATLGRVLVRPRDGHWHFMLAPPRRSH